MSEFTDNKDDSIPLVFDIGHFSIRFGYCGESTPREEFPSMVGVLEKSVVEPTSMEVENDATSNSTNGNSTKEYFFDTSIHCAKKNMELQSFLEDGMIEDWDMFEKYMSHIYDERLKLSPAILPILMSEPSWNARDKRLKLVELMFEKFNVPEFFLCKNAVLATFANGRGSGIVVDSGARQTSVVPVQDGYVISKGIIKSPLGSDFISMQCKQYFKGKEIEIIAPYMIETKEVVGKDEPAKWTPVTDLPEVSISWKNYMIKKVLQDFQSSVLHVCDTKYEENTVENVPTVHYEFPNGFNRDFGAERYQIAETLFNPSSTNINGISMSLPEMVKKSVSNCDVDMRSVMYHNVIVTGGNTLLQGFCERLSNDLSVKIPSSMRLKIYSASGPVRRYGAWIGGSIIASLSNVRSMFISKSEYNEEGKVLIESRCP